LIFVLLNFHQSLATLYFRKEITLELALSRSSHPEELQEMINRGAGIVTGAAAPTAAGRARA
jgi:twitching motility protein PilT